MPQGHWTRTLPLDGYDILQPGLAFEVIQPFTDFDGDLHPAGEHWTFLTRNFSPYHGGHSFFVSLDGTREWHIRMQEELQSDVVSNLSAYLRPLAPA